MINFYHGAIIPSANAQEGIYFIKNDSGACSIYAKVSGKSPVLYAEVNEVTSATLEELWDTIGNTFVAKTFQVAGMSMEDDITVDRMKNALQLKNLAYKNNATGTLNDYVTEVQGVDYTPTGQVEVITKKNTVKIISSGSYTPEGNVLGSVTPNATVSFIKDNSGTAISGTISTPEVQVQATKTSIKQIANQGTLPSYTPASYTAPSLSSNSASFATQGMIASISNVNSGLLEFSWASNQDAITKIDFNKGTYTQAEFDPGTLPTINDDLSVVSNIDGTTVSTPVFTGDKFKTVYQPQESEIVASFEGTTKNISVEGNIEIEAIDSTEFKGSTTTITPILTKEDKVITVQ